jgi:hypothetical protein
VPSGPRASVEQATSLISAPYRIAAGALRELIERSHGPPVASAWARQATIDQVIKRMEAIAKGIEEKHGKDDGVLAFNKLYLAVTRGVKRAVETSERAQGASSPAPSPAPAEPLFNDPRSVARLDVIFADLYFAAIEADQRGAKPATLSWRVLFEARDRRDVLPVQFAFAGMNAHINHDLPIALLEQWELGRRRPSNFGTAKDDFTAVNEILKAEEAKLKPGLEPNPVRKLDKGELARLDDKLGLWVVETARAHAWGAADQLWDVRKIGAMRRAWLATVDAGVSALSETLVAPV